MFLLHIFNHVLAAFVRIQMGEDMKATMVVNWQHVCCTILKKDEDVIPQKEKKVLTMVTKNVFHRKPSVFPITFVEVEVLYALDLKIPLVILGLRETNV